MEINVCFGINDNYCQHCACTIASILYNSNPKDKYNFHIISDFISDMNRQKLESLKYIRKFKLFIHEVNIDDYLNLDVNNQLGPSSFFRFKAFELFAFDKVIYLDADIIVRKDIGELYKTDIDGYYCAGVEDILNPYLKEKYNISPTSLYINSGVMLINLKYCREHNVSEKINEFLNTPWKIQWGDQDIINFIWQNGIKSVDLTWNCAYCYNNYYEDKDYYHKMAKDPAIIHYITSRKPWIAGMNPHLKLDYFRYLRLTPYYNEFMPLYQMEENSLVLSKLDELKALVLQNQNK